MVLWCRLWCRRHWWVRILNRCNFRLFWWGFNCCCTGWSNLWFSWTIFSCLLPWILGNRCRFNDFLRRMVFQRMVFLVYVFRLRFWWVGGHLLLISRSWAVFDFFFRCRLGVEWERSDSVIFRSYRSSGAFWSSCSSFTILGDLLREEITFCSLDLLFYGTQGLKLFCCWSKILHWLDHGRSLF